VKPISTAISKRNVPKKHADIRVSFPTYTGRIAPNT
jgi:hypothetical protein